MKLLFLEQFSELGGGQRNLLDLLPAVIARGWTATVAAPGSGPLFDAAHAVGAQTVRIDFGDYSSGTKSASDAARFWFDTVRLGRWIARQDFDLLSVGGARIMPAAARGARGRPVVFQAQHFLGKKYAVAMTTSAIRRANAHVIANSKHVASQFPVTARVVYNGIAEIPFKERSTNAAPRIGIIGRIAPMKGQADFLISAKLITQDLPNARFVICGAPMFTPQSYVDEVHRLAAGLPVEFQGWCDNIATVLRDLDLLIAPSTAAEATTRVILEAFSAGVPVVAYAIGGIPEIVRDGENGFLVPECDPGALARKIIEVLRQDLSVIVRHGRRDYEQHYTMARYQQQMIEQMIIANGTTTAPLRSALG